MAESISGCLRALRGAADAQAAAPIVETFLSSRGVETYQFHDTRAPLNGNCFVGRPDPQLTSRVEERQVWRSDPLHLRRRIDPVVWSASDRACTVSADADRLLWSPVMQAGYKQAVLVPIHGPAGDSHALTVFTRETVRSWRPTDRLVDDLILMAYYLNRLLRARSAPACGTLTRREADCLRWTAQGKTAWEIGQILAISERTANFHLQNAMRKLGASSKYQAALEAIHRGMIAPL